MACGVHGMWRACYMVCMACGVHGMWRAWHVACMLYGVQTHSGDNRPLTSACLSLKHPREVILLNTSGSMSALVSNAVVCQDYKTKRSSPRD